MSSFPNAQPMPVPKKGEPISNQNQTVSEETTHEEYSNLNTSEIEQTNDFLDLNGLSNALTTPLEGPIPEKRATSAQRRSKSRSKSRSPVRPTLNEDSATPVITNPNLSETSINESTGSLPQEKNEASLSKSGLYEQFSSSEIEVRLANPREDPNSPLYSVTRFEDLDLSPELLRGLYAMNFTKPSKIQEKALPLLLSNPPTNLIAQSQSGTGKTAAFALTMLKRANKSIQATQAVCIANTRELAKQIAEVLLQMSVHTDLKIGLAVKEEQRQRRNTPINDPILVGTPGTLLELARRRLVNLSSVKVLVFDEADAILDAQNLMEQAQQVRRLIHKNAQILLFSATFPEKVKLFAQAFAPNANQLILKREEVKVDAIHQFYLRVTSEADKCAKLSDLYGLLTVGQSIIFVRTRRAAYDVCAAMTAEGHQVSVLTGMDSPHQRDAVMDEFRKGKSKVLISTDVLSRGIDVPQINLVINYDMPVEDNNKRKPDFEAYVHRIGRTGRFGRSGIAINFIDSELAEQMQREITESYGMHVTEMACPQLLLLIITS